MGFTVLQQQQQQQQQLVSRGDLAIRQVNVNWPAIKRGDHALTSFLSVLYI